MLLIMYNSIARQNIGLLPLFYTISLYAKNESHLLAFMRSFLFTYVRSKLTIDLLFLLLLLI